MTDLAASTTTVLQAPTAATRRRMRAQPNADTNPEMSLRRALHARGYRYRVHCRPLPTLNRRADIVFRRQRVAVFVDGCFWHGCTDHRPPSRTNTVWWQAKIQRTRERDAETTRLLQEAGWTVIRVWEHDVTCGGVDQVVETLAAPG